MTAWLGLYRPTSPHPARVDPDRTHLVTFALTLRFGAPSYSGKQQLWTVEGRPTPRKSAWEYLRRRGWIVDDVQVFRKRRAA